MREDFPTIRTNKPVGSTPDGVSVIPNNRLNFLAQKCQETLLQTPGNVLEVGVYKGGSLIVLAQILKDVCPEYHAYGIDTFSGHPYTDGHPVHPLGKYDDVDLSKIISLIQFKGLSSWVSIYQGKVEERLEDLGLQNISFAHIDCDLYIPVKYCAEHVPKLMNKQGLIFFDDYGHEHCPGATRAVEEVFANNQICEVYMPDDNTCWSGYVSI